MKRAASYARFSTDLQNDRSIPDQHADNRKLAKQFQARVVIELDDSALSGSSIKNRPGIQELIGLVRDGTIDMVIAEATSRISRDQEDRAYFRKRLEFHGVEFVTSANGVVTELVDGMTAVVDSQQIRDLRHQVRRGQRGRIQEGLAAGGLCYGYKTVKGEPGVRVIDETQAEIVRRIYAEYLSGRSPRAIAAILNREGIAPPRGKYWRSSTLNGNAKRGNGILRNPIYAGCLTWNRVKMVKNPDTARRISQPNKPEDWITVETPKLAIVDRQIFDAVQHRKAEFTHIHPGRQKRPKHILSGLLRCAACGGGMSTSGSDKSGRIRIRCSTAKEGDACPAPATFYLDTIEKTVLDRLRTELRHPEAIAEFVRAYHEESRRLSAGAGKQRAAAERRLGEVTREITRLVDAIAKGHGDPSVLGPRSSELDSERQNIETELTTMEQPKVIALHPAALVRYEQTLERLQQSIGATVSAGNTEAADAMHDLIESVTVARNGDKIEVVIAGRLNSLLGIPTFGPQSSCRKMVAGESYRHSPFLKSLRFELRAVA